MNIYDAEGEHNPVSSHNAGIFSTDEHAWSRESWCAPVEVAQTVFRIPLEEMAMLASTATADTVTQNPLHIPAAHVRSAYSLLLEPALFKFPA